MSDNHEVEMTQGETPMGQAPQKEERKEKTFVEETVQNIHGIDESIDSQSYFLGEVPQTNLVDPAAFLPLNSDQLVGSVDMIEQLLYEVGLHIEEEVAMIQKHQKRIALWEDRIEKNKAFIKKNENQMKQNQTDALYDKKNRDYWYGRCEEVEIDYSRAEVSNRLQDWCWLIKKYGLKNADGSEIDPENISVEELCNGEVKNLAAQYRSCAEKYENARKEKEAENSRLIRENAKVLNTNDTLKAYISSAYSSQIEPLQDGVLLMKELGVKLKAMKEEEKPTYGQLRLWAESFLDQFIRNNPQVPQTVVTHFRRLTSIPLPPEYC